MKTVYSYSSRMRTTEEINCCNCTKIDSFMEEIS
jgi:hypothetical protein